MKTFKNYLLVIGFFLGGFYNAHAQTMMNLEDIEYYLENSPYIVHCHLEISGSYDGDRGIWMAPINRSFLPVLDETIIEDEDYPEEGSPLYGIMLFVHDHNDDHCYLYDLGLYYPFFPAGVGSLEYDGTGILQYLQDPILNLGEDEEIPADYIYGAYFQCEILDFAMSYGTTTITLAIYSLDE